MSNDQDIDVDKLLADAKSGDAGAQFVLGERFRKRAALDIDLDQAVIWYKRAAADGHAEAQYRLGRCHAAGSGVVADQEVALTWYVAAAE